MQKLKNFFKSNFEGFTYFYRQLGNRIFTVVVISIGVGVLDGLGLSMFLPLLQMFGDNNAVSSEKMGNLAFLIDSLRNLNIPITLTAILAVMCTFFILKGLVVYLQGIYLSKVNQYFIHKIRTDNIRSLNLISYKSFMKSDVGQIQNTLTGEITKVSQAFNSYFLAFQQIILVFVYMSFAFFIDAQFAILITIGGALTNLLFKNIYKKTKGASKSLTLESNGLQALIIQHVAHYKYLKATGQLGSFGKQLLKKVDDLYNSGYRIGKMSSLLKGAREPLIIIVVAVVIIIQVNLLEQSLGPILISLLFFYRALTAIMGAQTAWNYYLGNSGSLENVASFSKMLWRNKEKEANSFFPDFKDNVQIADGSINIDGIRILRNINLQVRKNETIAFVGESGSGKTTLVNTIAGLLPLDEGYFLIDNNIVPSLNNEDYKSRIGYITQEPVIFNDSIFNNVTFWAQPNTTNINRFYEALRRSSIHDFVLSSPKGADTILGSNGINISGGQKQRISIARELYKDLDILIMDEATSALDTETENAIQNSIDSLKGKYTIFIVAHRLSTIKNADHIVLMKNGEIIAIGNYNELIRSNDFFKRMVELQEL